MTVGERLVELRRKRGLIQSVVADALGMTQARLCYLERDRTEPRLIDLCCLATFYGCTLDYLADFRLPGKGESVA